MNEEIVENNASPVEGTQDTAGTTPDLSQTGDPSQVGASDQSPVATDPVDGKAPAANSAPTDKSVINWEEKYKTVDESYRQLRKKLQEQGAEKNEYKKRFESLEAMLKRLGEEQAKLIHQETYDPDQFVEELRAKGPQYFVDLLKKQRDELLAGTTEEINSLKTQIAQVSIERALESRRANSKTYPDFAALEDDMNEIYNANKALFDGNFESLDEKIDALYNAAVLKRSPDAIKKAEALGRKQTEEELAREAHSGGAGGGGTGAQAAPDPRNMSADQLKKFFADKGMVSDGY